MGSGQARSMEMLRRLVERLSSADLTIGEAKLVRLQLIRVVEAVSSGDESHLESPTSDASAWARSCVETPLAGSARSSRC